MIDITYSLITIVNKEAVYKDFLDSLNTQVGVKYELIAINNEHNQYSSARTAYNVAARRAKGEYLIFLHPDIRFLASDSLARICNYTKEIDDFGLVGIAGSPKELVKNERIILTNIIHGDNKETVPNSKKVTGPTEVQTLDEAFFIMKKSFWEKFPFPNKEGWHLYAVEQCLIANINGYPNYVVPANIWHTSDGKSEDYRYTLQVRKLIREYRPYVDNINTTVKRWRTRGLYANLYSLAYLMKMYLKYLLNK